MGATITIVTMYAASAGIAAHAILTRSRAWKLRTARARWGADHRQDQPS